MIFQYIKDHPQHAALALSATTFLAGLLIGNWQAIGRDKRKEFNDIADRIRTPLVKQRTSPSPFSPYPNGVDVHMLCDYLWPWERSAFRNAVQRYEQARKDATEQDEYGGAFYSDHTAIQSAIIDILRFLKRR